MSNASSVLLPTVFPAAWACEWGQDRAGLFMDVNINRFQQRFRWIEPGTFLMGCPDSELERLDRESLHEVTITIGYWLADSVCTQGL